MGVTLAVTLAAVVMMVVEALRPGPALAARPRLVAAGDRAERACRSASVFLAGATYDRLDGRPAALARAGAGTGGRRRLGYLAITFVYYWWHRGRHEVAVPLALVPPGHHSPQRIEIITSFYKHPFEIARERRPLERDPLPAASASRRRRRRARSRCRAWRSSSTTGTCRRRTGWASSSSGPRATASITRRACTRSTTPTCRCGTCCSARSATRAASRRAAASGREASTGWRRCCAAWTWSEAAESRA